MVTKKIKSDRKALIIGDSIDEILEFALPLIRPQSKEFYRKEIKADLEKQNYSWIDIHAGMMVTYNILLIPESYIQSRFDRLKKLHYGKLGSLKERLVSSIIKYSNSKGSEMTKTIFRVTIYQIIVDRILKDTKRTRCAN